MNSHLKSAYVQWRNMAFVDGSDRKIDFCIQKTMIELSKPEVANGWAEIRDFFDNNDIKNKPYSLKAPCHYIEDSSSAGRHRQHLYVTDKTGRVFQIYALSKPDCGGLDYHDENPLAAIAQGLFYNDINEVKRWFDSFRLYANKQLKGIFKATKEDLENYPSLSDDSIKSALYEIGFLFQYDLDLDYKKHDHDLLPNLEPLVIMSRKRYKEELKKADFVSELDKVISEIDKIESEYYANQEKNGTFTSNYFK